MEDAIEISEELNLDRIAPGSRKRFYIKLIDDGLGIPIHIPIMVAKGIEPGPTLAITAAVHGNELNGIPIVQRVFSELDNQKMRGTVIGVPVVNVPGLLQMQRKFNDGEDLNHIMPGKEDGNTSDIYAFRFVNRILQNIDYLIDLHTASFGRVNSYYIRANMHDTENANLARLQNAQIIVDSPAPDGTLRWFLSTRNIKGVTLEVGDPNRFQKDMIRASLVGIENTLVYLNIRQGAIETPDQDPVICSHSYWQYTDDGGLLQVHPEVADLVKKGEKVATLRNIFGDILKEYRAKEDGVIIGKSSHPVAQTGSRIIHLGIIA